MRRRLPLIGGVLAVAILALVAVLVLSGRGDDDDRAAVAPPAGSKVLSGEGEAGFALFYPASWEPLKGRELGAGAGRAVAGVKRGDDQGLLLVQARGPLEGRPGQDEIARDLTSRLKRQFKDFRRVSSSPVQVAGGRALSYTFVRTRTGRVQNIVVLSQEERTWTLNSVVPGGADAAARELATMIRSFRPTD